MQNSQGAMSKATVWRTTQSQLAEHRWPWSPHGASCAWAAARCGKSTRGSPSDRTHHAWSPAATPGTRAASIAARTQLDRSPNRADASLRGSTRGAAAVRRWRHPRTTGELETVWCGQAGRVMLHAGHQHAAIGRCAGGRPSLRRSARSRRHAELVARSKKVRNRPESACNARRAERHRWQRRRRQRHRIAARLRIALLNGSRGWVGTFGFLAPAIGQSASARAVRPDTEAVRTTVVRDSRPGVRRLGEGLLRPEPGRRPDPTGERSHDPEPVGRDRRLGGCAWSGARAVSMATSGQVRGRSSWRSGREGERPGEERHVRAGPRRRRSQRGSWSASSGSPRGCYLGRSRGAAKPRHVDDLKTPPASSVATPRRQLGRAFCCRVRSFEQAVVRRAGLDGSTSFGMAGPKVLVGGGRPPSASSGRLRMLLRGFRCAESMARGPCARESCTPSTPVESCSACDGRLNAPAAIRRRIGRRACGSMPGGHGDGDIVTALVPGLPGSKPARPTRPQPARDSGTPCSAVNISRPRRLPTSATAVRRQRNALPQVPSRLGGDTEATARYHLTTGGQSRVTTTATASALPKHRRLQGATRGAGGCVRPIGC